MTASSRTCICGDRFVAIGTPTPWLDTYRARAEHQDRECIFPPPRSYIRRTWPYRMETA